MKLSNIEASDVLRTAGAMFLLTRKSTIAKALGFLWLAGEVAALAGREAGGVAVASDALLPFTGKTIPAPVVPHGDELARPAFAGLGVLLQGYG